MISAASHQRIFLPVAFSSTSCNLIIRSTSGAEYAWLGFPPGCSAAGQSGQIPCELDRTTHILTTRLHTPLRGGLVRYILLAAKLTVHPLKEHIH